MSILGAVIAFVKLLGNGEERRIAMIFDGAIKREVEAMREERMARNKTATE
jgi:hypothetical protein